MRLADDERDLLRAIAEQGQHPGQLAEMLGIKRARSDYLFRDWAARGWYEYGRTSRDGRITQKGFEALEDAPGVLAPLEED